MCLDYRLSFVYNISSILFHIISKFKRDFEDIFFKHVFKFYCVYLPFYYYYPFDLSWSAGLGTRHEHSQNTALMENIKLPRRLLQGQVNRPSFTC